LGIGDKDVGWGLGMRTGDRDWGLGIRTGDWVGMRFGKFFFS